MLRLSTWLHASYFARSRFDSGYEKLLYVLKYFKSFSIPERMILLLRFSLLRSRHYFRKEVNKDMICDQGIKYYLRLAKSSAVTFNNCTEHSCLLYDMQNNLTSLFSHLTTTFPMPRPFPTTKSSHPDHFPPFSIL